MIDAADINDDHVVVELGAGTGPFTKEIFTRYPSLAFMAIEPRQDLAKLLRAEFPSLMVQEAWAQDLPQLLEAWGHPSADRIVSGLPWALWSQALQDEILSALVESMAPQGKFVTFTYLHSGMMPGARLFRKNLSNYFGTVQTSRVAWLNFPPAYAFICEDAR
jgi:phosphatidylethanolamine/phosphatidyl-N-methylethanolamine N-methyltransferase